ncbi:MAG TPA: glycosyltransferase [bacterium]|nr:glycosyltransferase [bacterium]
MKLHIIIPAWNEEEQIRPLFEELIRVCSRLDLTWSVCLIDDGSSDGTVREAERFESRCELGIISHPENRGVDEAFRTGFNSVAKSASAGDLVLTMEANKNADPTLIPRMIAKSSESADIVLASCYAPGGTVVGDPFLRFVLSKGINMFLRTVFPCQGIHTYTSFYRLWNIKTVRELLDRTEGRLFHQKGFVCMADLLLKARRIEGIRIREVPMILKSDIRESGSKMKVGRTIFGYLRLILSNLRA